MLLLAHVKYFMCRILHAGESCIVLGILLPLTSGHSDIFNAPGEHFIPSVEAGEVTGNLHPATGHIQNARLSAGILLMSPFNRKYFFDFYDIFISFDNIKYRKGSPDMKTVDRRGVGIIQFFLVSIRKRIFYQAQDFINDNAPGFFRQYFQEFFCFSFNDKCIHALFAPRRVNHLSLFLLGQRLQTRRSCQFR